MLTRTYHYNQVVKKSVAVFGTLFNNITIGRISEDGKISNIERVPIAYGPKKKFLARITQQADLSTDKVAIKIPRMSFEIISIAYDTSAKLNRLNQNRISIVGDALHQKSSWAAVPYSIGMQLSIYATNQDDVLQCLEQILPEFQPEYTVVVKDMEAPGLSVNVPITLNNIALQDDYTGAIDMRRTIVYSLDFTMRVRFSSPPSTQAVIRFVEVALIPSMDPTSIIGTYLHAGVSSVDDTPDNYAIISTADTFGFDRGFIFPGTTEFASADSTDVTADSIDIDASTN